MSVCACVHRVCVRERERKQEKEDERRVAEAVQALVNRGSSPWNGMIIRTDEGAVGGSKAERVVARERERIKSWTVSRKPEKNCKQDKMSKRAGGIQTSGGNKYPAGVDVPSCRKYLLANEKLGSTNDMTRHAVGHRVVSRRDNTTSYDATISHTADEVKRSISTNARLVAVSQSDGKLNL